MASLNVSFSYNVSGIFMQDIEKTIKYVLHQGSPTLGNMLVDRIVERTQILTGALQSSITHQDTLDADQDELTILFADEGPQMSQWNRVYVQYQEGGVLGMSTYTNAPREMFAKVLTDDLDIIADWGVFGCQLALDMCVAGQGIPI